ncbi:MAG: sugar ABC transporter permease [Oscillospiraceae bacterium]
MANVTAVKNRKLFGGSGKKKDIAMAYLFIMPAFISLIVFLLYPIVASFVISGFDWGLLTKPIWVGLSNYKELFHDEIFITALKNTFKWVIVYVPMSILASLGLALAMDMPLKGIGVFRTLFYLPVVTPIVVVSLLFVWIYNQEFGILNYMLSWIGVDPIGWLTDKRISLISIAIMSVWKWAGYNMLILLSALQGIPESLYEAAELDGITPWKKLIHIKIPLIMPSIYFVMLTSVIDAFQVFTEVYIMTNGGPGYATHTVSYYLWTSAFQYSRMGYACAMAVIMFIIILTVTVIQDKIMNKKVQYDS